MTHTTHDGSEIGQSVLSTGRAIHTIAQVGVWPSGGYLDPMRGQVAGLDGQGRSQRAQEQIQIACFERSADAQIP